MEIDKELFDAVNLMCKGEEAGFNVFYQKTYQCVYFRAKQLLNNEEDIRDLIQDVYVEAYRSIGKLENVDSLYPWLKQITFHMATKMYRKKKEILLNEEEQEVFEQIETKDASFIPELSSDRKATSQIVAELIDELPELQRTTVIAYYFDEFSINKIAEMMECPEGTIKSRLNYARAFLKTRVLEKEKREGYALHSIDFTLIFGAVKLLESSTDIPKEAVQSIYHNICSLIGLHTGAALENAAVAATETTASSTIVTNTSVKGSSLVAKWIALGTGTKIAATIGAVAIITTASVGGSLVYHHFTDKKAVIESIGEHPVDEDEMNPVTTKPQEEDANPVITKQPEEATPTVTQAPKTASMQEVLKAYYEFLTGTVTYSDTVLDDSTTTFTILDMNHDGIPELLLDDGMDVFGMAVMQILYCYDNGSVVPIATAGHGNFEIYNNGDIFASTSMTQGYFNRSIYQIQNGKLVEAASYSNDSATGVKKPKPIYMIHQKEVDKTEYEVFIKEHTGSLKPDGHGISGTYPLNQAGADQAIADYKNKE